MASTTAAKTPTGTAPATTKGAEEYLRDGHVLKYQRVGAQLGEVLAAAAAATPPSKHHRPHAKKGGAAETKEGAAAAVGTGLGEGDHATAITVHESFVVLGTSSGAVHVFYYSGERQQRCFRRHSRRVNAVCVDKSGSYIVSCSDDGSAALLSVRGGDAAGGAAGGAGGTNDDGSGGDGEEDQVYNYNRPLHCVAMDPNSFGASSSREKSFVLGTSEGQVVLNKQGWLFSSSDTTLFDGGGSPVTTMAWCNAILAWADHEQVRLINVEKEEAICYVERPSGFHSIPCKCSLFWETPEHLYVGWADSFRIIALYTNDPDTNSNSTTSSSSNNNNNNGGSSNAQQHQQQQLKGGAQAGAGAALSSSGSSSPSLSAGGLRSSTSAGNLAEASTGVGMPAEQVVEWQTDCIICGVAPFDADNIVVLGYVPDFETVTASPDGGENHELTNGAGGNDDGATPPSDEGEDTATPTSAPGSSSASSADDADDEVTPTAAAVVNINNMPPDKPELQILNRLTGELVSADSLPLRGFRHHRPAAYSLATSYLSHAQRQHFMRWRLDNGYLMGGGSRSFAPFMFIMSPLEVVLTKVRDTDDRIAAAIADGEVGAAMGLAWRDRQGLKRHRLADLVDLYLTYLVDRQEYQTAAKECARLLGSDEEMWERWIYTFDAQKQLAVIAPYIPTSEPRLPQLVYNTVLTRFLETDSNSLLRTIRQWGNPMRLDPMSGRQVALYDRDALRQLIAGPLYRDDPLITETQAELYVIDGEYGRALQCYLSMDVPADQSQQPVGAIAGGPRDYKHVFELIEREGLFEDVRDRVANLVRLSRKLSGNLLIRNLDRLPVPVVVPQLQDDREMLHWYLDLVFRRVPDVYNTQEYKEFHAMQVYLYAEFAPSPVQQQPPQPGGSDRKAHEDDEDEDEDEDDEFSRLHNDGDDGNHNTSTTKEKERGDASDHEGAAPSTGSMRRVRDTAMLRFLRRSNFAPLDLALRECEDHDPPLYQEMVFIHARMGNTQKALELLLHEIGDVRQVMEFVESTGDATMWDTVIDFALEHKPFLSKLLQYVGHYKLDARKLLRRIPDQLHVKNLQRKLERLLDRQQFELFVYQSCSRVFETDTLTLLRKLNQQQRRAIKVDPRGRCATCQRPLYLSLSAAGGAMPQPNAGALGGRAGSGGAGAGVTIDPNGVSLFTCRHGYHTDCLRSTIADAARRKGQAGEGGAAVDAHGAAGGGSGGGDAGGAVGGGVAGDLVLGGGPAAAGHDLWCVVCHGTVSPFSRII